MNKLQNDSIETKYEFNIPYNYCPGEEINSSGLYFLIYSVQNKYYNL